MVWPIYSIWNRVPEGTLPPITCAPKFREIDDRHIPRIENGRDRDRNLDADAPLPLNLRIHLVSLIPQQAAVRSGSKNG